MTERGMKNGKEAMEEVFQNMPCRETSQCRFVPLGGHSLPSCKRGGKSTLEAAKKQMKDLILEYFTHQGA